MSTALHGVSTPSCGAHSLPYGRGVVKLIFAAVCVLAGAVISLAQDMGVANAASAMVAIVLFSLIALTSFRWAILFVITFSLFSPLLTRAVFSIDFPYALEQSMLDYHDPLATTVSLLLLGAAALAVLGHVSAPVRLMSRGMLAVVVLYALVNCAQVFNPNNSLIVGVYGAKNNVLPVLMLFAGSFVVRSPQDTARFVTFIALFSVIALSYGLYQELAGLPAFEAFWYTRTADPTSGAFLLFYDELGYGNLFQATRTGLRVPSVFQAYTFYSIIITAFGIIVYAARGDFAGGIWKPLRIATLVLLILYFALSMERSAIVMFGAGVLAVHFVRSRERKRFVRFLLLGGVAVAVVYGGFSYLAAKGVFEGNPKLVRIGELANPFAAATVSRGRMTGLWPKAIEEIRKHPLIGTGAGSGTPTRAGEEGDKSMVAHCDYLHKLMELGPFGLFSFLLLLFFLYRRLIRKGASQEEPPVKRAFAAGMVGVLAAYVLLGVFNVMFLYETGIVFWFLAGAALGTGTDEPRRPCGTTESPPSSSQHGHNGVEPHPDTA